MTISVEEILTGLRETANLPIEKGKMLSARAYTSKEFFDLEQDLIFSKDWLCVGRVDQLPKRGDYLTSVVANVPAYTINVGEGAFATFRNTCSHRGAVLLEGSGNASVIVCPYHAWSYVASDGRLRGAPHMERSTCFDRAASQLPGMRTEVWEGWIYVTVNAEAQPVQQRLQALQGRLSNYSMADYRTIHSEDYVWNCNWKVLVDNFLDEYHPFWAHRNTFGELVKDDIAKIVTLPGDSNAWTLHFSPLPDALADAARKVLPTLEEWQAHHVALFGVYPTHLVALIPGGPMFSLSLSPNGVERVHVRYALSAPPRLFEVGQETPEQLKEFFARVNAEDKEIVEKVFRGLSASWVPQGSLSHLEWSTWEFQQYLLRRLGAGPAR